MAKQYAKKLAKLSRKDTRKKEQQELIDLKKRIEEYDPESNVSQFADLPLSQNTINGLKHSSFVALTDIQKSAIPVALKGHDVMGAARTGSGKTLAFLVPVIECLTRNNFSEHDGLGALIISPTRELAMQIFDVLVSIGKYNQFSAGLVIGGKDVKYEMDRVGKMNILVGTPGRILQHMDQAVSLETNNLQMLVLDEADRILDMGFKKTLDAIIKGIPPTRQTLLFSATQSENVSDLARLSLTNPQRVGVSEVIASTPVSLEQSYTMVKLDDKLDILWSFIKGHLKTKMVVFFASSKQLHFVFETFRKLQPGIPLMKLHGRQKQTSRTETINKFFKLENACLLATDIVARGIDFPAVKWVVQVDCPEDAATYVHRVGRSARFGKKGKSLLLLTPSEEAFLARLKAANIEPKVLKINTTKKTSIKPQLQSLCFKDPEIKYLGQKAFISYFRSVYVQKDKDVFKVEELPSEDYAKSLGLPGAPKIKILGGTKNKELKNASRQLLQLSKANDDGEIIEEKGAEVRTKYDRMFERQNQNVLSEHYLNLTGANADEDKDDDEEEEDDFMQVKRTDHQLVEEELPSLTAPTSKRASKKALSKKASSKDNGNPTKLRFDDEGNAHAIYELEDEADFYKHGDAKTQIEQFVSKETETMSKADVDDKEVAKEKRQEKKRKRQEAERRARDEGASEDEESEEGEYVVQLGGESSPDLDKDMEYNSDDNSDDEKVTKKPKWFQKDIERDASDGFLEIEEPQTLEDLEALTARLLQG